MSQPTHRSHNIARNAISNWAAFLYVAGVSFFLSPFIVKHLGATAYGVWSLLVALVGYLGLLDFGVRGAVTRYIAQHHAVGDAKSASGIASGALVLFGGAGVIAVGLASLLAYFSPVLFNVPPELADTAKTVLVIGGFTVASTLIGAVFGGVITGLERFDVSSGIEFLITTARTIGVIVVFAALVAGSATIWTISRRAPVSSENVNDSPDVVINPDKSTLPTPPHATAH